MVWEDKDFLDFIVFSWRWIILLVKVGGRGLLLFYVTSLDWGVLTLHHGWFNGGLLWLFGNFLESGSLLDFDICLCIFVVILLSRSAFSCKVLYLT